MKIMLETPRLVMRHVDIADADGFLALDSDPLVQRYVGNRPLLSLEEAIDTIVFIQQQYVDHGIGRWALSLKADKTFIGWAGFKWVTDTVNGQSHYHDLGYRLIQKHWGNGYATEAAQALVEYAFDNMHLQQIIAIADARNIASHHVLSKAGLPFLSTFDYDGIAHHWYAMLKDNFHKYK